MSRKRQKAILDDMGDPNYPLTTHAYDYYSGFRTPEHFHHEDQLLYASRGVMTVRTPHGLWVVPPHRGVWIPANLPHSTQMSGTVAMRTLWFKPNFIDFLPRRCQVLNISPLLRELILHSCKIGKLSRRKPSQARLMDIIAEQLEEAPVLPLQLPMPEDPRALKVAEILTIKPDSDLTLSDYARRAGTSKRTLERLFEMETKMTFGKWRQQLRLLHAIERMAAGESVTTAALDAGYESPSAFTAMFRRALGTSPSKYFASEPK